MAHRCSCHAADAPVVGPASISADETVAAVIRRVPGALAVMQRLGVNHCCGADLSLAEAAAAAGVPLDTLLQTLGAAA